LLNRPSVVYDPGEFGFTNAQHLLLPKGGLI
jgi:hypothetical protein